MPKILESEDIAKILPHAYPFVLIDRVTDYEEGKSLTAVKNITANEWCFGEGQESDIYPETLLIEAAAQAALVLYKLTTRNDGLAVLGKVESEFERPSAIGDRILLKPRVVKLISAMGISEVELSQNDRKFANVQVYFSILK